MIDYESIDYESIEIGDSNAFESVAIFEEIQRRVQAMVWDWAEVDRHTGLMLVSIRTRTKAYFRHAVCGYDGTGSLATLEILEQSGFGSRSYLAQSLIHNAHHVFFRTVDEEDLLA